MSSRAYFAWRMVVDAEGEDQREEQRSFQTRMRVLMEHPIERISCNKFVQLYRLSKEAVDDLCHLLEQHTELKSTQRVSLDTKVVCALLFYANGDYQRIVGEANHFSQETMSIYIKEVTEALNHPAVQNRFIKFPKTRLERDTIKQGFYRKFSIPGVIGCIDCSHFKIFKPYKDEEHLFYCRKHYHSLNVQMLCDPECRILAVNAKFGGASHDAFIWENSNLRRHVGALDSSNEQVWLLGDSGYPQRPWIMTPYSNPGPGSIEEGYNKKHVTARVIIENTFGRLKNRWRCLGKHRVMHYQPAKCAQIILACAALYNMAIEYKVPDPEYDPALAQADEFVRHEVVLENEAARDLLRGRAVRD